MFRSSFVSWEVCAGAEVSVEAWLRAPSDARSQVWVQQAVPAPGPEAGQARQSSGSQCTRLQERKRIRAASHPARESEGMKVVASLIAEEGAFWPLFSAGGPVRVRATHPLRDLVRSVFSFPGCKTFVSASIPLANEIPKEKPLGS